MTYWRLHYHLIWATFERQPIISGDCEKTMFGVIYQKGKELDLRIHAAGSAEDHVHLVVSIPPKLSVADCVKHLKGATAHAINHMPGANGRFQWQPGYAALSLGERSLPAVIEYVAKQKEHHAQKALVNTYERLEDDGAR